MGYQISKFDNGLSLITYKMPHIESASIGIWIKSGSRDEAETECWATWERLEHHFK